MRLKALMSLALILGVVLLFMTPALLRQRPHATRSIPAPGRLVGAFQVMIAGYVGACAFSFMTAGCLSMLIMRNTREEFSRQAMANVQALVEGTMEDLRSKDKRGTER